MTIPVFADQIALVTGASRGIGAATAIELAARGAHVIITARTAGALEAVEETIFNAGGSATIAPMNLTDGDSISRLAAAVKERWGRLDIMVMNAAMLGSLGPVASIDGKEFNQLLTLNLLAQQSLLANFDPMLKKSANARIFALTSSVGNEARPFWGGYGASKAALESLTMSYAQEVKNLAKVRVAIIDPGKTRTLMREQAYPGEDPKTLKTPDVVARAIADLADTDFATGTRIRVDG